MRFALTARTIARIRGEGQDINEMTLRNIEKVTRYRANGENDLEKMVEKISDLNVGERSNSTNDEARWGGRV